MFNESDSLSVDHTIPDRPRRPKPRKLPSNPSNEWLGSTYNERTGQKDVRTLVDRVVRLGFLAATVIALGGAAYWIVSTLFSIYSG